MKMPSPQKNKLLALIETTIFEGFIVINYVPFEDLVYTDSNFSRIAQLLEGDIRQSLIDYVHPGSYWIVLK